ncbi:hypothetical protein [Vibrio phage vB_pir03]|nr:hypothetical protein [Vibrio phage vB_pir03]
MNVLTTRVNSAFGKQIAEVKRMAEEALTLDNGMFIPVPEVSDFKLYKVRPDIKDSEIPNWNMVIDMKLGDENIYIIDARPYENANRRHNPVQYNLAVERARAVRVWYEEASIFTGIRLPLVSVYMDWVGGLLRTNASLTPVQQAQFELLFGLYLYCAITSQAEPGTETEELINGYRRLLTSRLNTASIVVNSIFEGDNLPVVIEAINDAFGYNRGLHASSLDIMCRAMNMIVDTKAITLDGATMATLSTNSWMGDNAAMLSMNAVQHPAILASMIAIASVTPLYRRSRIGQAVETQKRKRIDVLGVHKAIARG